MKGTVGGDLRANERKSAASSAVARLARRAFQIDRHRATLDRKLQSRVRCVLHPGGCNRMEADRQVRGPLTISLHRVLDN